MPSQAVSAPWRQEIDAQSYLVASSALSVYLWQILYSGSFNFVLGYVVVLVNSCVLLSRGALIVHRNHVYFMLGISLVSAIAATMTHNPVAAMASQILGISVYTIYYYSFLSQRTISLTRLMEIYSSIATVLAIGGFFWWLVEKAQGNRPYRLDAWFHEPSHYVYATLPALSFQMLRWQKEGVKSPGAVILGLSYLLADSSTGYLGIAITFLLMADVRSIKRILIALMITAATAYAAYTFSDNVRLRVDGTLQAQITQEAGDAAYLISGRTSLERENQSTFSLLSNGYVAWNAFIKSPIIGNGLGTHTYSYEIYASDLMSRDFISYGINRTDANSLALRLVSETGIFGLSVVMFLLIYFGRVKGASAVVLRNAMIPYFAMRLMRYGAYFSPELYFFAGIYAFNSLESRKSPLHPATETEAIS